ncbi:DUF7344 domain-containing protein [Natrinema limicola]|uniref:DUF7344 domain-containing protein n=1 Tax=Natrinema limicola JCM 13563 TaxID=1230457 RepID=M0C2T7_9EURY|nr:hypothetical protein [Natrinema limicola]ELZ17596.1 hypothetical protein C476_15008 [Natrinema limicola JCM 13563]
MSNSASSGSTAAVRDEFFDALADARRRTVLQVVYQRSPDELEKDDLARHLAAVTMDTRPAEVTDDDYQGALVDIHHRLVPSLTDAGLLETVDDETVVLGDHPAFDDSLLEGIVSARHDADDATLDAVFRALAADRRRTVLSILAEEDRPLETETLARRVAAREAETAEREVAQERVDEVATTFVHVHGPMLADASLVDYDAETGRVVDVDHPIVDPEWIRPGNAAATATGESATVERHVDDATPATHQLIYRARPRSP